MSYQDSIRILTDVRRHINEHSDPVSFDLASGLATLSEALESDMKEIQDRLSRIETLLKVQR